MEKTNLNDGVLNITPLTRTEQDLLKGGFVCVDGDPDAPSLYNGNCATEGGLINGNCACSSCGKGTVETPDVI